MNCDSADVPYPQKYPSGHLFTATDVRASHTYPSGHRVDFPKGCSSVV